MASTYDNDLRLNEMATGDGSGTWGETTNLNLSMIAEAFSYQTEATFGSDADVTATVADGASDKYRAIYIKVTSVGSLSATRTLTVAPTSISKMLIVENATSGSQSISVKQGSGATVTIPNSKTKVLMLEGTGSGAGVIDALDKLALSNNVTINDETPISAGSTTTFTNKTFDANATGNSISNIENADINASAAIAFSKMENLTASKVLQSDCNGDVSASGVTNTELGYLSGVTSAIQTQIQNLYPVGSIYINGSVATNPNSLLGFGTWERYGEGRVLVSQNGSDSSFDTLGETGGSKDAIIPSHTHTASVTDPTHSHTFPIGDGTGSPLPDYHPQDGNQQDATVTTAAASTGISVSISSTGTSATNQNLQPYITVYMWRRTS